MSIAIRNWLMSGQNRNKTNIGLLQTVLKGPTLFDNTIGRWRVTRELHVLPCTRNPFVNASRRH